MKCYIFNMHERHRWYVLAFIYFFLFLYSRYAKLSAQNLTTSRVCDRLWLHGMHLDVVTCNKPLINDCFSCTIENADLLWSDSSPTQSVDKKSWMSRIHPLTCLETLVHKAAFTPLSPVWKVCHTDIIIHEVTFIKQSAISWMQEMKQELWELAGTESKKKSSNRK